MKIPLSWLKDFVDITVPMEELAHRLTMAGLEVAEIFTIGGWENCYVGYVEKVEAHPNADRLSLCTVNIGDKTQQVVCGAPNVAERQKIAFAKVGARLIDAHTGKPTYLKAAKIRGVVSEGMVCSGRELGLSEDHDGIIVLPDDAPVGKPLTDYLGDQVLDLEVTPNRPDWLSILGVAYEIASLTGTTVHEPLISYPEEGNPVEGVTSATIADPDLCPRYTASLITDVTVGPSPDWIQSRLIKAGMRPINNVVDITNYVMLEYGQPLHPFDFDTVLQKKVVVRRAHEGEILDTLDGVSRTLKPTMLVIADGKNPIGLGGVIGGINSEITENTRSVLLESASFAPSNNRQTAQALSLRTEATIRFEKGLRPGLVEVALRRAIHLIHQVAGGTVAKGILDHCPGKIETVSINLTEARIRKVLGVDFPITRAKEVLISLGFGCQKEEVGTLRVAVPYWRTDVNIEDDLVEEIARIVGYDSFPTTMISAPIPAYTPEPSREFREMIRDLLVDVGMQEVVNYSVTSLRNLENARVLDENSPLLRVANPMSSDHEYLRPTLRSSLLGTLAANLGNHKGPISIFEIGRIYIPTADGLPEENETVVGLLFGPRTEEGWLGIGDEYGFYDVKGLVESVLNRLNLTEEYQSSEDNFLHPGKAASILVNGSIIGVLGEVHPLVQEAFEIGSSPVAFFELQLSELWRLMPNQRRQVEPLPRYPSAIRDISLLVDRDISASRIQAVIAAHPLVERAVLFDVYEGDGIAIGKSSCGYRIYFQSIERTLSADEVTTALDDVVKSLASEVGASLRQQQWTS